MSKIAELEADFTEANARKEGLQRQLLEAEGRLQRAEKLLGGLGEPMIDFMMMLMCALCESTTSSWLCCWCQGWPWTSLFFHTIHRRREGEVD